jgi:hypothetical protein
MEEPCRNNGWIEVAEDRKELWRIRREAEETILKQVQALNYQIHEGKEKTKKMSWQVTLFTASI